MRTVTIDITPAGSVKIDAKGFTGGGCAKATEQLEVVLGGNGATAKKKKKPEFYSPSSTKTATKQTF